MTISSDKLVLTFKLKAAEYFLTVVMLLLLLLHIL